MSIVNFSVTSSLDKRIKVIMKEKGFSSKAEFFRFAAIHFIDVVDKPFVTEDDRFEYLADELASEVVARYKGKKLLTVEEQLADL